MTPTAGRQSALADAARPKVFCVGLAKTGTSSLATLLEALGYRVQGAYQTRNVRLAKALERGDPSELLTVAERVDAVADEPWPYAFRELDHRFPGSRFILTKRDADEWLASVVNHFGSQPVPSAPIRRLIYGHGSPVGATEQYRRRFSEHNRAVQEYFSSRPDALLVVDLSEANALARICAFLGAEAPFDQMPRTNVRRGARAGGARRTFGSRFAPAWRGASELRDVRLSSVLALRRLRHGIVVGGCDRGANRFVATALAAHPRIAALEQATAAFCEGAAPGRPPPKTRLWRLRWALARQPIPRSATHWLEHTPRNTWAFGAVLERFGDRVRLLHVVRDGRDFVAAATRSSGAETVRPRKWLDDVTLGRRWSEHRAVLTVRYEDLLDDLALGLDRIWGLLDLEPPPRPPNLDALLRQVAGTDPDARRSLEQGLFRDPRHVATVERFLETETVPELLQKLGYEL